MTQQDPNKRPDCEEILNRKSLWSLYDDELEIDNAVLEKIILTDNDINLSSLIHSIFKSLFKQKFK